MLAVHDNGTARLPGLLRLAFMAEARLFACEMGLIARLPCLVGVPLGVCLLSDGTRMGVLWRCKAKLGAFSFTCVADLVCVIALE